MKQYLDALQYIMDKGVDKPTRTGIDTRGVFGMQFRYNMADGFPAMTTKKLAFNAVKGELLWFLSGSSDVKDLHRFGVHIWDENAEAPYWKPQAEFEGDVGRIYGVQWRRWRSPSAEEVSLDQIYTVIEGIKKDPYSRRHLVVAWNPGELYKMALPPCHVLFHFFVEPLGNTRGKLSVQMYQRSCDMFLGVPFNIASYSLLLHMVSQVTGLEPGEFVHTLGDAHIYHNHFDQVKEQLSRAPYLLPKLWLNPEIKNIDDFKMDDIKLIDYQCHPGIKAPMAV